MASLFISYRREDSAGYCGRLFDTLEERFAGSDIFRDIESLDPGVDFPEALTRALERCRGMLVVIGPEWVSATGSSGRRLDAEDDFVRYEVAAGLRAEGVHVGG